MASKTVLIAYKTLPAYRRAFFDSLHAALREDGVRLVLAYGDAYGSDRLKRDTAELPWAIFRSNRFFSLGRRHLLWQPVGDLVRQADLVIVEQASRLLLNYHLLLRAALGRGPRIAMWGHGANLQGHTASRLSETAKRWYSRLPHWWFAYTESVARHVRGLGYPSERITVVQNAIDTSGLAHSVASVSNDTLQAFREQHRCVTGATGLFIGGLYEEKRLQFLIEAADRMHEAEPRFTLLVAGDGPHRTLVEDAARTRPHVRYLGRVDGELRATALRSADVVLMPGLVGLGILDSFAGEAPLITTAVDYHSPEIDYLIPEVNGVIVDRPQDVPAYAQEVLALLRDADRLERLREGCRVASARYTNEEMVARFRKGVLDALAVAA